jgi:hypothetical protein
MKIVLIVLSVVSGLLVMSTTICGVWVKANGAPADSVAFHGNIAMATAAASLILAVLVLVLALRGGTNAGLL